ncbi:MAG: hypothetical protein OEW18_03025 [Candidatus Aminicenantes bacterium]|nr:hypothetical protein [Candidatus Aminicenantes bacterium]
MTTEERLEKLELELKRAKGRFRWLLAVVGLCLVSVVFVYSLGRARMTAHASESTFKEVRTTNFVLEDGKGKTRGSLGMSEDGLELRLRYGNGNIGASLCLHDDKVVLSLFDNNGKPRAVLGLAQKMPLLCLYDEREEPRATLAVLADGPHLILRDEKGKPTPIR